MKRRNKLHRNYKIKEQDNKPPYKLRISYIKARKKHERSSIALYHLYKLISKRKLYFTLP
jgi:hypothetical protein